MPPTDDPSKGTEMRDLEAETAALGENLRKTVAPPAVRTGPKPQLVSDADWANASRKYELEDRPQPPPVPNGWYSLIASNELEPGDLRAVIAVGRELVTYRDHDGAAHVVDAHCPHMGAHLGGGQVKGDTIECPYHAWRYGPDGQCVEIPYSDARIPAKACLRTYPVREVAGMVLFWFHHGNKDPQYEVPALPEHDADGWSPPHEYRIELVAALQEMAENNVDYAHLWHVHGRAAVPDRTSEFSMDGPFSTVVEQLPDNVEFHRNTYGPGVAVLRIPGLMTIFATTTPIDRRHCRLLWHFYFADHAAGLAEMMVAGVTGEYGLMADVPIWQDKVYLERPLLVKGDGNIAEFRRWYSQFYEDA
jgi:nitrite reductase/ring-hydroxylating ferredoxin subunit